MTSIEQFKKLKDGLRWGTTFGITIAVLLIVRIIGIALYFLYKKYEAKKA